MTFLLDLTKPHHTSKHMVVFKSIPDLDVRVAAIHTILGIRVKIMITYVLGFSFAQLAFVSIRELKMQ